MPWSGQYPLGFLLLERYCWCYRYLLDVTRSCRGAVSTDERALTFVQARIGRGSKALGASSRAIVVPCHVSARSTEW